MGRILRKITSHVPKRAKSSRDTTKRRLSKENNKLYNEFVDDVHAKIQEFIKEGAQRFNKPLGNVRNRIFTKTRLSHPKELVWQAYVHVRSKEINEGKAEGERKNLQEILQILAAEEDRFSDRPDEEKAEWIRALQEYKADRDVQKRRDRKGEEIDHAHTINNMAHEMEAAEMRYGLQSFFMAARSDAQQRINPVILCSDNVKEFIALFMGKTPEQMVRMFELWAVNGSEGVMASQRKNAKQLRSEIRHFVQMKLNIILSSINDLEDTIEMNYASYETAIVARYGVRLVGWTYGEVCNPGEIPSKGELEQLHTAIINKSCRWERVPEEQRADLVASAQPRKRAQRSDKGKPRGPYKKTTSRNADKENTAADVQAAAKARAGKASSKKKRADAPAGTSSAAPVEARIPAPAVPAVPAIPAARVLPAPVPAVPAVPAAQVLPVPAPVPAHMIVPSHMLAPIPAVFHANMFAHAIQTPAPAGMLAPALGLATLGVDPTRITALAAPIPPPAPGTHMF